MAAPLRKRLALCGFLAPVVLAVSSVLAEAAQPAYSPVHEDLSTLAALNANQPWIMIVGMVGTGALICSFSTVVGGGLLEAPEACLLFVAGLAVMGAGAFRIDCSEPVDPACSARSAAGQLSWHDTVHNHITAVLALAFATAPVIGAVRLWTARPAGRAAAVMSLFASISIIALGTVYFSGMFQGYGGLMERGLIMIALAWIAGMAVGVRRLRVPEVAVPMAAPFQSARTGPG
jgi:uncharacterized protein DUF998